MNGGSNVATPERTTRQVVDDTRAHLSELVDAHIELAKAEFREDAKATAAAVVPMVLGGLVAVYVLTFALITLVKGLTELGLLEWAAWGIVTLALLVIALVAFLVGRSKAKRNAERDAAPARVKGEVQGTVEWAKTRIKQEGGR